MFKNIKYIYVDLDGTTVYSPTGFSQKTLDAFAYLRSKGIKIGIATGRSIHTMQLEVEQLKPDLPIITINGAAIISKNLNILEETFLPQEAKKAIDILNEFGFSYMLYSKTGLYSSGDGNRFFRKLFEKIEQYPDKFKNFELETVPGQFWLKNRRGYKILVWFDTNNEKQLLLDRLSNLENVTICSSGENILDICPPNVSKGRAIKTLVGALQIDPSQIAVFGDNENDLTMFELVTNSVAMKNANQDIQSKAKFVTELECTEDGFADFVFKNF